MPVSPGVEESLRGTADAHFVKTQAAIHVWSPPELVLAKRSSSGTFRALGLERGSWRSSQSGVSSQEKERR